MSTPIINLDLTKQAPHSPRERTGGFAITEECRKLGLAPELSSTFDWLEADDRASFKNKTA